MRHLNAHGEKKGFKYIRIIFWILIQEICYVHFHTRTQTPIFILYNFISDFILECTVGPQKTPLFILIQIIVQK